MPTLTMCSAPLKSRPRFVITVHHPALPPSNADWETYCQQCNLAVGAALAEKRPATSLVFSDGPGPNAAQRKSIAKVLEPLHGNTVSALVSSSTLARGICTALNWIGVPIRAFHPDRWQEALACLEINTPAHVAEARALSQELLKTLAAQPLSVRPFLLPRP